MTSSWTRDVFLSCQLSWCRRPWPQCRAQVTVYWATRKTHAISTVSQVEMCPEAVVYKYTLSLSHFFGFVFGQFYQHTLVTASVRGMERREAGLPVWLFLGQILKIWPFSILFGLRNFILASGLFQNTSYLASFWPFYVESWHEFYPFFRQILLLFSNLIFKWPKSGEFSRRQVLVLFGPFLVDKLAFFEIWKRQPWREGAGTPSNQRYLESR